MRECFLNPKIKKKFQKELTKMNFTFDYNRYFLLDFSSLKSN